MTRTQDPIRWGRVGILGVAVSALAACATTPTPSATSEASASGPATRRGLGGARERVAGGFVEPGADRHPDAAADTGPGELPGPGQLQRDDRQPVAAAHPGHRPHVPGTKDGKAAVDVVTVTAKTAVIGGVTCLVIEDKLTLDGALEEETADYYTQDLAGNVWYFGEDTKELDAKGKVVSREGSWHAGVDGAVPGIFMEANPAVGHEYTQELYQGHAEDHYRVKRLDAAVDVPFGSFTGAQLTEEWTPLEPDVLDNKVYVQGIGEVSEVAVKGPTEELRLVKVEHP